MTIEPTEFDLVALARRGLQALLDEAVAEVEFARKYAMVSMDTRSLTPASAEAKERALDSWTTAKDRLARFDGLHPEAAPKPEPAFAGPVRWLNDDSRFVSYQP